MLRWFLLLVIGLPALLAWDPADGDIPWQPEEIALFELVDEINGTFYELMDISRNATTKEVKTKYKELAMVIHPDKNPDTEAEFKQLAAVYNMLKDKRTRAMYERILEEGLPDWRMPAMYDRKVQIVRHIGLLEGMFTLFVLATFIQYGMHWAAYLERKMNKQAEKKPKAKKTKKAEAEKEDDDESILGPKPTVYDTLPFQVYELCKQAPTLPGYLQEMYEEYRQRKEEERKEQEELEEERKEYEEKKLEKQKRKASGVRTAGES
eukprot:GFUD01009256.1.p1 GENE.GFUD01009256.1~~GFUD01009256.1.p1  ORF type:complete len:265 (-),score=98.02 GFUD01009256.1:104-898(-)